MTATVAATEQPTMISTRRQMRRAIALRRTGARGSEPTVSTWSLSAACRSHQPFEDSDVLAR